MQVLSGINLLGEDGIRQTHAGDQVHPGTTLGNLPWCQQSQETERKQQLRHSRDDYNQNIQADHNLIPEDEPVFLIRAQDVVSSAAVYAWADFAKQAGASAETVASARRHAHLMSEWPKKEVPDLPGTKQD